MAKLKVYRTPIGFHDAYVAAPSQKAALAAWGSDRNLFAQGSAELVTDAELSREPLEKPGTVVKRSRGTAAEQMAALPPDAAVSRRSGAKQKHGPPRLVQPRPDRIELDLAEQALSELQGEHRKDRAALAGRIAALELKLADLTRLQHDEMVSAKRKRDAAATLHEDQLKRWRASD